MCLKKKKSFILSHNVINPVEGGLKLPNQLHGNLIQRIKVTWFLFYGSL